MHRRIDFKSLVSYFFRENGKRASRVVDMSTVEVRMVMVF